MDAPSASDMLTVLQYVDHFYATSWNHLLVCAGVAVGIVGVVIPVLFQIYQTRTMRVERAEIRAAVVGHVSAELHERMEQEKAFLEEKIAAATKSLGERLARDRAELEQVARKTEAELRKGIARASGAMYHLQANWLMEIHDPQGALTSGIPGLSELLEGDDHFNLRRLLSLISSTCLPQMTKAELDEMEEEKEGFLKLMARIRKWDVKGDFEDAVKEAKREFKAACERVSPVKTQGS